MITSVHPFPARMAPDLALDHLRALKKARRVLDPMVGSGTVLRHATDLGHQAVGFDMDPLAVLMSRVWTTPVSDSEVDRISRLVIREALQVEPSHCALPWIDEDVETRSFINYWFGTDQRKDLRALAYVLNRLGKSCNSSSDRAVLDVLKVSLSRIIITKEQAASLARDTSHSRPHRVVTTSDYSVFEGFSNSVVTVRKRLSHAPPSGPALIAQGDARSLPLRKHSVDAILTSPPYLNAIDYMRGHRLALVWLGYRISELRAIRSNNIGAERQVDDLAQELALKRSVMGNLEGLSKRHLAMIDRYIVDVCKMTAEVARVLRPSGTATFVVGNSCLTGVFINNAELVSNACKRVGLNLKTSTERDLPEQKRYLPMKTSGPLQKRMRTETILCFAVSASL